MSEAQNTKIVQDAFAAFARGDIVTLLGLMTDDIQWQPVIVTSTLVPISGVRTRKGRVAEFREFTDSAAINAAFA